MIVLQDTRALTAGEAEEVCVRAARVLVRAHVEGCPACREEHESLLALAAERPS